MRFYSRGLGDTGASQKQNFNDFRIDGHGAIMSPAFLVLLFWGQCWTWPEGCMGHWQVIFEKQWMFLTPEFPALPTEDSVLLLGGKLMFLTCQ